MITTVPPGVTSGDGNGVPEVIIPSTVTAKAVQLIITLAATSDNFFPVLTSGSVYSADAVTFLVFVPVGPDGPEVRGGSGSLPDGDGPGAVPVGVGNGVDGVAINLQCILGEGDDMAGVGGGIGKEFLTGTSLSSA